jgi:AcrR family transcriptional regulator
MVTRSIAKEKSEQASARGRILDAAFSLFMEHGYAATSTLEIATRARVSKRELYAQVGSKQEMLAACINERARRLQVSADLPALRDREDLARTLTTVGTQLLREITDPTVIGVFRLAIAEVVRAPEIAQTLDSVARQTVRTALREILAQAQSSGLLDGEPAEMAERFSALLWGNLMVGLLLGVAQRPSSRAIAQRARDATTAFLQLHPPSDDAVMR